MGMPALGELPVQPTDYIRSHRDSEPSEAQRGTHKFTHSLSLSILPPASPSVPFFPPSSQPFIHPTIHSLLPSSDSLSHPSSLSFASSSFHPNFSLSSHPSAQPSSSPPSSHFLPFLPLSLLNVSIHPSLLFPSFHPPTHPILLSSFPLSSHPCWLSTQSLSAYLWTPT